MAVLPQEEANLGLLLQGAGSLAWLGQVGSLDVQRTLAMLSETSVQYQLSKLNDLVTGHRSFRPAAAAAPAVVAAPVPLTSPLFAYLRALGDLWCLGLVHDANRLAALVPPPPSPDRSWDP